MKRLTGPLLSISECARQIGIGKPTLWKQVQNGRVRSHDGKLILAEVIADRAANVQARPTGRPRKPDAELARPRKGQTATATPATKPIKPEGEPTAFDSYSAAQARRESAVADMRQFELAQKRGLYVLREEADRAAFDDARLVRDAWLAWPERVKELLAAQLTLDPDTGLVDVANLGAVLSDFVAQHLTDLAGGDAASERRAA